MSDVVRKRTMSAYRPRGEARFPRVRFLALLLMVFGQAVLALFAPSLAAVPAFASFLAAGLVLTR